jgi:hypothetical protein
MSATESHTETTNTTNEPNDNESIISGDIQTLRAIHQVRLITEKEEGTAIEAMANGVYGFTYSPQEQSPIFSKRMFQIFEVHKTLAGEIQIIGFISDTDAQNLADKKEEFVSIELYPEPYRDAHKAIGIPKSHILEHRGPTRENGNALKLKVEPFTSSVQ